MNSRILYALAGASLAVFALAGCGSSDPAGGSTAAAGSDIGTASTNLGQIVVNGKGLTAYVFDKDSANSTTSACTGGCTSEWSAITSASATPKVDGVTGKVATLTGTDGTRQVTIDGRRLYTYADDKSPGDAEGQGEDGVWHVVTPSGKEITKKAPAAGSGGY